MGSKTAIAWTDYTFNPWEGCTMVSPGCAHCYAATRNARFNKGTAVNWGKGAPRRRTSLHNWNDPIRWNKAAAKFMQCTACGYRGQMEESKVSLLKGYLGCPVCDAGEHLLKPTRPRVFCASLADWLDDEVPIEWLVDLLDLIRTTPHLDWQLLTKRPENFRTRVGACGENLNLPMVLQAWVYDWFHGNPPANVWIGTTMEDQPRADARMANLLSIPARVRFISAEPLLGPVDFTVSIWNHVSVDILQPYMAQVDAKTDSSPLIPGIHWVIVGGESGHGARSFVLEHAAEIVRLCEAAEISVFVKQLGAQPITTNANLYDWPDDTTLEAHGTEAAGARVCLKSTKGDDLSEWPEQFQIQQFP